MQIAYGGPPLIVAAGASSSATASQVGANSDAAKWTDSPATPMQWFDDPYAPGEPFALF